MSEQESRLNLDSAGDKISALFEGFKHNETFHALLGLSTSDTSTANTSNARGDKSSDRFTRMRTQILKVVMLAVTKIQITLAKNLIDRPVLERRTRLRTGTTTDDGETVLKNVYCPQPPGFENM